MIGRDDLADLLSSLCPMHLLLDRSGRILRAGPTIAKLAPDRPMPGQRFLDLFQLTRPRSVADIGGLWAAAGAPLRLRFRDPAIPVTLKGVCVPLPDGGGVVNLSFGISVLDAVRDHALTSADFANTDLAIELLYLVEAKSAAMEASRNLNRRLQGARIAAEERAFTDTLTGLKNRRAMDHVLNRLIARETPFALLHLDLDFFKAVNDTMGHAAGDHVLQHAARIMVEHIREDDTAARVGGDEFVLILRGRPERTKLKAVADRLIDRLEEPIAFNGRSCRISASIGIALAPGGGTGDAAGLLNEADLALYAAKHAGRGCARFCDVDGAGQGEPGQFVTRPPASAPR